MARVNVEDMPSSSTASTSSDHALYDVLPAEIISIQDLHTQLAKIDILPWTVNDIDSDDETFKLEFYDGAHGIAKFTVIVKAGLDFTVFVYHWPIPDDYHYIYTQDKRLLNSIE